MTHYDHPARIMAAESQIALLKAALREALEAWEWWIGARQGETPKPDFAIKRITKLRKFLDDK